MSNRPSYGHGSLTNASGLSVEARRASLHALVVVAHGWRTPARELVTREAPPSPVWMSPLMPDAPRPAKVERPVVVAAEGLRYVVLQPRRGTRGLPRLKLVLP